MLLVCQRALHACLDGCLGHHCLRCCINGIRYWPGSSCTPMRMGLPLHVISTSSSLKTVTPLLVNIDMVPLSKVLPTLIRDVGKSWKVSTCCACTESLWNGSWMTGFAWLVPPLATPTLRVNCCRMERPALTQSLLLRWLPSRPEFYVIMIGTSQTELWAAKLMCRVVLLSFLSVLLKAKRMLYAVLHPRCTRPIFGVSRVTWAKLIALRLALVASFLAKTMHSSSVLVMLLLRNRLSLSRGCCSVRRTRCCRAILCCRRCSLGSNMMVLLFVLCEMGLCVKACATCVAVWH